MNGDEIDYRPLELMEFKSSFKKSPGGQAGAFEVYF
jgi:hypothetical protein